MNMEENQVNVNNGLGVAEGTPDNLYVNPSEYGDTAYSVSGYTPDNAQVIDARPQETQVAQIEQAPVQEAVQEQEPQAEEEANYKMPDLNPEDVRIVVKSSLLKDALKKADVVAGKVDMQLITQIVMFRVVDGNTLQVRSTDRDNVLTVYVPVIDATPNASMTLLVSKIKPLIDKASNGLVTFVITDSAVKVITADGEYMYQQTLNLTTNEVVKIPDIDANILPVEEANEIDRDKFLSCLEYIYPIVEKTPETHKMATIYMGDIVAGMYNDRVGAVLEDATKMFGTDILLKLTTVKEIMSLGIGNNLKVAIGVLGSGRVMSIYTDNYRLFSILKEDEEGYPVEEVKSTVNTSVGATAKLNKTRLLKAIDRLSLFFTSDIVRQTLDIELSPNLLKISNENKAFETFSVESNASARIKFDTDRLVVALKSVKGEDIYMSAVQESDGSPISAIKISNGESLVYVIGTAL